MVMTDVEALPAEAFWRAVAAYLRRAYGESVPARVTATLDGLRALEPGALLAAGGFERCDGAGATRYALRLGNAVYPHMKLVLERSPRGPWLFRADTHDLHVQLAPDDPERAAWDALRAQNRSIGEAIEAAWEAEGIPTFREFLRRDLAARRG